MRLTAGRSPIIKSVAGFGQEDAKRLARHFVGKGEITQALAFGELARQGRSSVLSIAFVVGSERRFNTYVSLLGYMRDVSSGGELLDVRRAVFASKWGGYAPAILQGLSASRPFKPGELNLIALSPGWRYELPRMQLCLKDPDPDFMKKVAHDALVLV
jgi:hypothetical protein